ncbi:MAG: glycosyltransferase family 2 protein [Nitrospiraceae bacterium]|nr:glycosyltransferase family 2 protein [Nitrospiraceae bacterium]
MRGPLISVIMPLYNKRPYVARSIGSIMEQTYRAWELIIVDDGSTDGSSDAVPRGDRRIKLLRQANMGPAAARNKAFRAAAGQYLAFIDADDCYYPYKLEHEMGLLWQRQKAEWMMSAYDYQLNGRTTRHYMKDIGGAEIKEETRVFEDALTELTVAGWPSDGLFMKKTLFERLSGFNEDMRYGEITELILRCALMQPRVLICHIPLYLHIDVPESTAKATKHKNEYHRHMGMSLHDLGKKYPRYAAFLMSGSSACMISYGASLVLGGRGKEARRFLREEFPFERDIRWWKLWTTSWLPARLLVRMLKTVKGW